MYIVQFWYGSLAEWTSVGDFPYDNADDARARIRVLRDECNDAVRFRVLQMAV